MALPFASVLVLLLGLFGERARASQEQADCVAPDRWECSYGCLDQSSGNCSAGLANESTCLASGGNFSWRDSCDCYCQQYVCDNGCWDQEDEACLDDTNEMQCAEIYGHVEWGPHCNCRFLGSGEVQTLTISSGQANLYFSVPAFVVLFRESLEVVIVLVIIIQFLHKAKDDGMITKENFTRFRREVYVGASVGFLLCMCIGVGFLALASAFRNLFKGDSLRIFDGVMMIITSFVLSFLALNFFKMIHAKEGHERKMRECVERTVAAAKEGDVDSAAGFGKKHSFLILAFTTGLREGLESIIFLVGVVSDLDDLSSLPLPIITALVLARICGCLFFQGTKKMRVEWFLRVSAGVLTVIAAGFFSSSMHKFQELGIFGTWSPKEERPWLNHRVYDARECCNDKTNRFFVLMRALLGWQDQPTPLEFIAYAIYWLLAISIGTCLIRRAKRELDAKIKAWREADNQEAAAADASPGLGMGQKEEEPTHEVTA